MTRIPAEAFVLILLVLVGAAGGLFVAARSVESTPPDFTVPTTGNETFTLSAHRGQVVVLEFFATTCAPCRDVESNLKAVVPEWNESLVAVASIAVWDESVEELRAFQQEHEIPWTIAQNADDANLKYNVFDIPHLLVLDAEGFVVYQKKGYGITEEILRDKVAAALNGELRPGPVVQYGLLGLAMVAGAAAFFSPCAIGMLPAYVAHAAGPKSGTGGGRATRGLAFGSLAALGVLLVFFGIGGLALMAGAALTRYVPYLQPLVGFLLIAFGILLLVRPYSLLLQRWTGPLTRWAGQQQEGNARPASYFAYGVGYGAAAAGCTTPVLLSVLVTAAAYGPVVGSGMVAAYALTGAFFMVLVTLAASTFRETLGPRLVRYSRLVESIAAALFILGGAYLLWSATRAGTFAA